MYVYIFNIPRYIDNIMQALQKVTIDLFFYHQGSVRLLKKISMNSSLQKMGEFPLQTKAKCQNLPTPDIALSPIDYL